MQKEKTNLIEKIKNEIDEENKIESFELLVCKNKLSVFYIDCLVDKKIVEIDVLAKLQKFSEESKPTTKIIEKLQSEVFTLSPALVLDDVEKIYSKIFSGYVVVCSKNKALCFQAQASNKRSIEEPPNLKVIKGPREGFVEDVYTNLALVRKRIKSTSLKIVEEVVGVRSKTNIEIVYLQDVADPKRVKRIQSIIQKINIDAIIDSFYIASFLEETESFFFRRIGNTEKPDVFCSKILEGRIGILVDGSPVALTAPFSLIEDLQDAEDYYTIPVMSSFLRIMRLVGLIFAIMVPGVYVALQSYNYRILPINFLISLLSSIEGLSVPPLVEILIVLFLFEIITEASIRMPSSLGMALSIIGALALGNTAVDAGIISPPSIVIVAISSVALYIIPDQISETRILRILFTTIGGIIGLYGIVVSFIILTTYMSSIESFGVPYLAPVAPSIKNDKKDGIIQKPIQAMNKRPVYFAAKDKIRQGGKNDNK